MVVFLRNGVREMLDVLSEFCTLFVYSHGLLGYIHKILDKIDPEERWFQDRERRIIAPLTPADQQDFVTKGKSVTHFLQEDMGGDWLIFDDQFCVIHEKGR